MITKTQKQLAELALIRAIPELALDDDLKPGRLQSLYARLIKITNKELHKLVTDDNDIRQAKKIVFEFFQVTGWAEQQRHMVTLLSFAVDMVEQSDFKYSPRIIETLTDIVNYMEQKEAVKGICCWAGGLATEKWRGIIEREN